MNHFDTTQEIHFERLDYRPWLEMFRRPVGIAVIAVTILLLIIVATSPSAWWLLGAGRGLVSEEYYPVWGFILTFGTLFGQAVGWAAGSAIAYYLMTLFGFPPGWATARLAMSIVYLGLAALPLSVYHIFYGGWLLSIPRAGLYEWLAESYPSAYWLLAYAHPVIDLSLIPLGIVFLGILWKYDERLQREPAYRTALALSLLGTSLAVALSLAMHSMLVHTRIGL
ncbi:MAG: hypothetical protein ACREP8_15570 [Candidatus Binatia bacterium]